MKVLVTPKSFGKLSRKPIQRLQDAGSEVYGNEKGRLLNEEEMVEAIQGMDAVVLGTEVFSCNIIDHTNKLKIVLRYGMGLDKIDVECLKERGTVLQITRNANTNPVADHTIGLMLSLCHNITRSGANIRSHVWKKPIARDLYQSTIGIPGLGAIGKAATRGLKGFNCHILIFDSYYDKTLIREYDIYKADMNEIVGSSDFLMLYLPALVEFSPLPNVEALSKMEEDAVIINTTWARLIDRRTLYGALHNGQLYSYGSDVHYMEPGFDEELITCENTVLTPHIAASNEGTINRMSGIVVNHMLAYFGCQQPLDNRRMHSICFLFQINSYTGG